MTAANRNHCDNIWKIICSKN